MEIYSSIFVSNNLVDFKSSNRHLGSLNKSLFVSSGGQESTDIGMQCAIPKYGRIKSGVRKPKKALPQKCQSLAWSNESLPYAHSILNKSDVRGIFIL